MKSFTAHLERFEPPLWGHHIIVPQEVSDFFKEKSIKRLVCRLNNEISIQCALMPTGNGQYFIHINKQLRKKLVLDIGDSVEVELEEDTSKYGIPMPAEMEELLKQDPEGDVLFHALTAGKQRSLLYMINKPKSSAVKLHKALGVIAYLKSSGGKVDFKALQTFMKDYQKF